MPSLLPQPPCPYRRRPASIIRQTTGVLLRRRTNALRRGRLGPSAGKRRHSPGRSHPQQGRTRPSHSSRSAAGRPQGTTRRRSLSSGAVHSPPRSGERLPTPPPPHHPLPHPYHIVLHFAPHHSDPGGHRQSLELDGRAVERRVHLVHACRASCRVLRPPPHLSTVQ